MAEKIDPEELVQAIARDGRVVDAMRKAMKAGKRGEILLISNVEEVAPPEVRAAFDELVATVARTAIQRTCV